MMGSTFSLLVGLASIVLPGPVSSATHCKQQHLAAINVGKDSTSGGLVIFGSHDHPWDITKWQEVSDTVRQGSSRASLRYLDASNPSSGIIFEGKLDTQTLGGAGFASQVYRHAISIPAGYTSFFLEVDPIRDASQELIRKLTFGVKNPPLVEGSSVIYQFDFQLPPLDPSSKAPKHEDSNPHPSVKISIPFIALIPTFRGSPKPDAKPFDPLNIAEISIMCRSFFNQQRGLFHLNIRKLGLE